MKFQYQIDPLMTSYSFLAIICDFQVLKESFKIYCAINDGIINLVDKVSEIVI